MGAEYCDQPVCLHLFVCLSLCVCVCLSLWNCWTDLYEILFAASWWPWLGPPVALRYVMYEGRSINKLQNSAIPLILKMGKIRNILFVGNLILNIHRNFFDDDVIIVMSSVH